MRWVRLAHWQPQVGNRSAGNAPEKVGTKYTNSPTGSVTFTGVSGYVDGTDGKAEFYIKVVAQGGKTGDVVVEYLD